MRYKKEVKELITWLKDDRNSMAELASALGYRSSSTIGKWIKLNKIPQRQITQVMAYIKKDEKDVVA